MRLRPFFGVLTASLHLVIQVGLSSSALAAGSNGRINGNGFQSFPAANQGVTDYGASSSIPGSITPQEASRVLFTSDPSLKPYGQADLYREGVQTLSTAVLYKVRQITQVQRLRDPKTPDPNGTNDQQIVETIGKTFCGSDDGETCAQRFLTIEEPMLRSYRHAIAVDQVSGSELQDGTGVTEAGTAPTKFTSVYKDPKGAGQGPDRKPPPKVKNLESLKAEFKAHEAAMFAGIQDEKVLQAETAEILMRPPNPNDFILTQQVLRDPNDPNSGMITIQKFDGAGKPLLDKQAYAEALKDFQRRIDPKKGINNGSQESLAQEYVKRSGEIAKDFKAKLNNVKTAPKVGFDTLVDGVEQQTFLETQHSVKEETQKQFDSNTRSIASKGSQSFPAKKSASVDLGQSRGPPSGKKDEREQIDLSNATDKTVDVYFAPAEIDKFVDPGFIPNQGEISLPDGRSPKGSAQNPGQGPPGSGPGQNPGAGSGTRTTASGSSGTGTGNGPGN